MTKKLENPEFYVNCDGGEYVWHGTRFSVVRQGEMRILYNDDIIRYTDRLEYNGITTDEQLEKLYQDHKVINNPWYEIEENGVDSDDFAPDVYHTLTEAIAAATEMENN
jgi:hypothetical protein